MAGSKIPFNFRNKKVTNTVFNSACRIPVLQPGNGRGSSQQQKNSEAAEGYLSFAHYE